MNSIDFPEEVISGASKAQEARVLLNKRQAVSGQAKNVNACSFFFGAGAECTSSVGAILFHRERFDLSRASDLQAPQDT